MFRGTCGRRWGRRRIGDILENDYRQYSFSSTSRIYFGDFFENIASIVSSLDSRNILFGELKKKYFVDFQFRRGPSCNRGSANVQNYRKLSFSRIQSLLKKMELVHFLLYYLEKKKAEKHKKDQLAQLGYGNCVLYLHIF